MKSTTSSTQLRRGRALPAEWSPLRILVVDDQPELLRVLALSLSPHEVTVADGPALALIALAEGPFDVVITDYEMPGGDGVSLLTTIAVRFPRAHRILFSGRTPRALGELRRDGTIDDFIEKPAFRDVVRVCDYLATHRRGARWARPT